MCGIADFKIEMGRLKLLKHKIEHARCAYRLNINNFNLLSVLDKWMAVICEDNIVLTAKYG